VCEALRKCGITANRAKCEFDKQSNEFFGMIFSTKGMAPTNERIRALSNVARPASASELQSFIGIASFSSMFIEHFLLALYASFLKLLLALSARLSSGAKNKKFYNIILKKMKNVALQFFDQNIFS